MSPFEQIAKSLAMYFDWGKTSEQYTVVLKALRTVHDEALDKVLAGIAREQSYREFREDQDGSGIGACKEIAGWVRAMKALKEKA